MKKTDALRTGYQIAVHNPAYLLKPWTWIYFFIRMATSSYWNHWAGIVESERGPLVMEMRGRGRKRGIRKTPLDIWLSRRPDRKIDIVPINLSPLQKARIQMTCRIGYDYSSLMIWQPLYIVFGRWLEPKFLEKMPYMTCSELWARLLLIPEAHRRSPGDLARYFDLKRK